MKELTMEELKEQLHAYEQERWANLYARAAQAIAPIRCMWSAYGLLIYEPITPEQLCDIVKVLDEHVSERAIIEGDIAKACGARFFITTPEKKIEWLDAEHHRSTPKEEEE